MNKNDIVKLKIESYGDGGEGVAKCDGLAVFVPFTIVGEVVNARIILKKKSYAVGKLVEVVEASDKRITAFCPNFTKCGGCQLQHMSYSEELEFKRNKVQNCISRIGFLEETVEPTVFGEKTTKYRNKLQMPLTDREGIRGGFFAPFSHRMVETEVCEIQDDISMAVYQAVKEYATIGKVVGYTEFNHKGLLRHVITRTGKNGVLVTLVINGKSLPKTEILLEKLNGLGINFGLYLNINEEKTNVITGDKFIHLGGLTELEFTEDGISYAVTPQSFLQVNEEVKSKIYGDAIKKADVKQNDVVVNAYSGAGLLTAYFAKNAKFAYGVEIIKEATESADKLAKDNGLTGKMQNITGDCGKVLLELIPKLKKEEEGKVVFVLDPPRKGVDVEILKALKKLLPDKIVYISCNPATLARDLGVVMGSLISSKEGLSKSENGVDGSYSVVSITPYDMFPKTKNVETLAVLQLNK